MFSFFLKRFWGAILPLWRSALLTWGFSRSLRRSGFLVALATFLSFKVSTSSSLSSCAGSLISSASSDTPLFSSRSPRSSSSAMLAWLCGSSDRLLLQYLFCCGSLLRFLRRFYLRQRFAFFCNDWRLLFRDFFFFSLGSLFFLAFCRVLG